MSKNISADTLFHFTPSLQNLENILKNGLYVRYSLENYKSIIDGESEIAFPMTCFCDIPLSNIRNHTMKYGNYAIGLTKEWGISNGVSPVVYAYPNSNTSKILNGISKNMSSFFDTTPENKNKISLDKISNKSLKKIVEQTSKITDLQSSLKYFIRYIKPYKGEMYREDKSIEVNFYDEREWRFLPEQSLLEKNPVKDSYATKYYKDPITRRAINIKLAKHTKLEFHPKDIRFIVVEKDEEIPLVLEKIQRIFYKKPNISSFDLQLLGTRLISLEQVVSNI